MAVSNVTDTAHLNNCMTILALDVSSNYKITFAALYAMLSLATIAANSLLIYTLHKTQQLKTISNKFILVMNLSDLVLGSFGFPALAVIYKMKYVLKTCILEHITSHLMISLSYFSFFMLACIAIDRYLLVTKLNQYSLYMNEVRMKIMIVVCFVIATGTATLMLLLATFELHVIITCNGVIFIIFIFIVYVNLIERLKAHVKRMEMSKSRVISKEITSKNSNKQEEIQSRQESKDDTQILKSHFGSSDSERSAAGPAQDGSMQESIRDPSRSSYRSIKRDQNLDLSSLNPNTKKSACNIELSMSHFTISDPERKPDRSDKIQNLDSGPEKKTDSPVENQILEQISDNMELSSSHFANSEPKQNPDISDEIQSLDFEPERTSHKLVENQAKKQIPSNTDLSRSNDRSSEYLESSTIHNISEIDMKNVTNTEVTKSSAVNQGSETKAGGHDTNERGLKSTNKQLSATRTIQILLACIFITYMPYNVTSIYWTYHQFLKKSVPALELNIIYAWSCFLAMINSCGNAIIIIYFNSRSRRFVFSLFKKGHVAGTT